MSKGDVACKTAEHTKKTADLWVSDHEFELHSRPKWPKESAIQRHDQALIICLSSFLDLASLVVARKSFAICSPLRSRHLASMESCSVPVEIVILLRNLCRGIAERSLINGVKRSGSARGRHSVIESLLQSIASGLSEPRLIQSREILDSLAITHDTFV